MINYGFKPVSAAFLEEDLGDINHSGQKSRKGSSDAGIGFQAELWMARAKETCSRSEPGTANGDGLGGEAPPRCPM